MGDPNMDFENTANLSLEDPPPILSNGVRVVLPLFASMLDVKSFMRLALTSKKMYERCMEDKRIKINIDEKGLVVKAAKDATTFSFHSFDVTGKNIDKYLEKLRQLNCNVSLKKVHFQGNRTEIETVLETRRFLEELGVKNIDSLKIDGEFTGCQEFSFIKDFNLSDVEVGYGVPDDILRILLQSNLVSFSYDGPIQGEMILQVDSPIPQLSLIDLQSSADVFTQILWKIQTGALTKLAIHVSRFPWDDFTTVPSDYDEPLPAERPLLIHTVSCNWVLHWDGAVTICEIKDGIMEIQKCEENRIPAPFKSKESVHKELAEKRRVVYCTKSHFLSFFDGIPVLDSSHKGPFPEDRPLLCKTKYSQFKILYHLLNEDGSIEGYGFHQCARYLGKFDLEKQWPSDIVGHAALQKYVFDKRIEKRLMDSFYCQDMEEFRFLFEDYEPLPSDFRGQLPERRPLVFKCRIILEEFDDDHNNETEEEYRAVFYEDRTRNDDPDDSDDDDDCDDFDDDSDDYGFHDDSDDEDSDYDDARSDCNFPDEEIKGNFRVVLYEDGTLTRYRCMRGYGFSVKIDPCPAWYLPSILITTENLKEIILKAPLKEFICTVDLDVFRGAFEGIKAISFDASKVPPRDRPLAFEKSEFCGGEIIDQRWLLLEDGNVRKCEWKDGRATLSKGNKKRMEDWPPTLKEKMTAVDPKCKESVHKALAEKDDKVICRENLFTSFFDGIPVLEASHKGPFPEERPLLCCFANFCGLARYLINEDDYIDFYNWDKRTAYYQYYDGVKEWPDGFISHTPLKKFCFDKRIQKCMKAGGFACEDLEEFRFLFEDYNPLPHDFKGQLPERRPLVFEGTPLLEHEDEEDEAIEKGRCIVLYEDGTLTRYRCMRDFGFYVKIDPCPTWYLSSILITTENLKEIILKAPLKEFIYNIDLDVFRGAFEGIKAISFDASKVPPTERPLAFEKTELCGGLIIDQRWLLLEDGLVRKCEWKDGRATLSKGCGKEMRDVPPVLNSKKP